LFLVKLLAKDGEEITCESEREGGGGGGAPRELEGLGYDEGGGEEAGMLLGDPKSSSSIIESFFNSFKRLFYKVYIILCIF
jgi:hypothetical protein